MAISYESETAEDLERVYGPVFADFDGPFDAAALVAEAQAMTGLTDLGGDALGEPGFRTRLDALCRSLEAEANLTATGRTRAHMRVLTMIVSRLRTVDYTSQRPEMPAIEASLIGTGMPRTGTSFLQALLAQDPANLVPRTAQAMVPVPPPGVIGREENRLNLVQRMLAFQGFDSDAVNAVHPFAPDAEDEDVLFQEAACGGLYQGFYNVPGFSAVVYETYAEILAWQAQLMRVVQSSQKARRWVLKAPDYMGRLDIVHDTFPDGMIFVNHRDPAKVIGSIASLYLTFHSLNSDETVPPEYLGPPLLQGQAAALAAFEDWRSAHPEVKIVDIHYSDLIADPIVTARSLYEQFGLTLHDDAVSRMEEFLSVNRHGQASGGVTHRYALADFGATEAMIEETFGDYIDRYDIVREARG